MINDELCFDSLKIQFYFSSIQEKFKKMPLKF